MRNRTRNSAVRARALATLPLLTLAVCMTTNAAQAQAPTVSSEPPAAEPAIPVQTTDSTSGRGLEEIVVTARKVAENLQDVPVAVTAFTGASLEQQNAVRVSDVARLTPSLSSRESPSNPSALTISLRGQVQTDILATLDPSVGTYVDNFYLARAYGVDRRAKRTPLAG